MQWDVFCRVIDNHGDIGVCWRLACDLAGRGDTVRLWTDDPSALAWMAPQGARGVSVFDWPAPGAFGPVGDVVVEAFGCELPDAVLDAMAARDRPPRWINLEYLSAEDYVARSHRLTSPQSSGPGRGLVKHFYYPGFTPATGGLIREPGLSAARAGFDAAAWRATHGIVPAPAERTVSVFCYPAAPMTLLGSAFAGQPTLLLLAGGATEPVALPPTVRTQRLPNLSQIDYDRLLWSCDVNFVRGEDSFVRAQWAAKPFVWQIYPQDDGAHAAKLHAFLDRYLAEGAADASVAGELRRWWSAWNGLAPAPAGAPGWAAWQPVAAAWAGRLQGQQDLVTGLRQFVGETS